jgi:peptidoglycan hydrolase-like protein with peptidoglycan-binding domain
VAAVPEPAAVPPSATADPPLDAGERRDVQRSLRQLGLYDYRIDAIFGPITRAGMRAFQERIGAERTGHLSMEQVELLHEMAAEAGG